MPLLKGTYSMLTSTFSLRGFSLVATYLSLLFAGATLSGAITTTQAQTRAYVASCAGTLAVIDTDTNTVIATVSVGSDIHDSAFFPAVTPDGTRVYVTNISNNAVAVIDTLTNALISSIPVGSSPYMVDIPGPTPCQSSTRSKTR
jgi:YVTN family beta-propeller protein